MNRHAALSRVMGALPEPIVRRGGRLAGRLAYARAGDRAALADRHMRRAGGRSGRHLYEQYGRYWAEVLWLDARKADVVRACIATAGLQHVEEARDAGRGMIYALPHVGNWEVAGLVAQDLGVPVLAVAEDLPDSDVTRWFIEKRRALALDIVIADGRSDLSGVLRERLSQNHAVALLCDRTVTGAGVEVAFFGEVTLLPAGPATLAIRSGAPILPVACYFRPGRGHRLVVRPPVPVEPSGSLRERVTATTQRVAYELEELIRAAPEQWHLLQPNWPSDPR